MDNKEKLIYFSGQIDIVICMLRKGVTTEDLDIANILEDISLQMKDICFEREFEDLLNTPIQQQNSGVNIAKHHLVGKGCCGRKDEFEVIPDDSAKEVQ